MKSIRRQLTILLAAGFGSLLVASGTAIYFLTRAALVREFDTGLRAKALALMSQTEQTSVGIQVEFSSAINQEFKNAASPQFYQIWRTNGAPVARSESLAGADLPCPFGSLASPVYWNFNVPDGRPVRAIGSQFQPRTEDEARTPVVPTDAILVVAADRRPLDRALATLGGALAATGLLALAVTVPLVSFSVRRGHAPLETLSRQAAGITAESLQARFPVETLPEELQPIITRLNDLLRRLESSFERERRFSADLAHELRTPLAELRAQAEVGLQFGDGQGAESHRETLGIALQMQSIVTRLLDLARCENGRIQFQIESVPLEPLVKEVWGPLAGQAGAKQLGIHFNIPAAALVQTDAALFRSILANLFTNAVAYTPDKGKVDVAWRAEAREFTVSNTVQDLKSTDLPHLFERLWRKDKSRSGAEHHGLGLALSRAFASALGLSLTARFTDRATLTLVLRPGLLEVPASCGVKGVSDPS